MNINDNINKINENLLIINKMNTYYKNLTYYNKYDYDIWITVIIFLIVLYVVIYYFILNNLQMLKNDWDKYKCNPFYMPFASIVNSENSEFTKNNYKQCLNQSNFKLGIKISKPFDFIFYIFKLIFSAISSIILMVMRFIVYLLMIIVKIFRAILDRILKIFDELNMIFLRLVDMVNHTLSIFTVIYYLCLKVIELVRFAFVLIQLAFFGIVVLPVIASNVILATLLIIQAIIAFFLTINPFTSWLGAIYWGMWGVLFIVFILSTIFAVFTLIINNNIATTTNNLPNSLTEPDTNTEETFQNLNDIEYDYKDKETIIKEKLKYIVLDTREKILAGNFKDININTDNLFFKDNKVLPKCCQYNPHYSSDKGCICSTLEQEEYLKRNGLNKSYNNNDDDDDDSNEKNININNLFFSPTKAFKGEKSIFNDVTDKDKNKYINKNDIFHSDLSKNLVYSKLYLQSR
jgi:hypothetical protein